MGSLDTQYSSTNETLRTVQSQHEVMTNLKVSFLSKSEEQLAYIAKIFLAIKKRVI